MLRVVAPIVLLCLLLALGEAQNNRRPNRNRQSRRPVRQNRQGQFLRNGVTRNGSRDKKGTEVYPGCKGKVCLPDAQLCAERQKKVGHKKGPGGKSYWFSWDSDEATLRNARWNWFTARNYCRMRCMDLITVESGREHDFIGENMARGGVREVWTSGRLCDKEVDGCDQPRFQPYNINGWFWAATLGTMDQQTTSLAGSSTPGPAPAPLVELSLTESSNKTASASRPAWPSWTTSSMTACPGTTPSATTGGTSSARTFPWVTSTL